MADRYWVGGTGTWNTTSTTVWSASSGGLSGASVPTAADNVFFDSATTYTVTMTGALACLDITVSAGTVTFATGTSPTLAVSGSMSLVSGTVWNSTGTITFNATTTGKTITTNGTSLACAVVLNGVGGGWSLGSAYTSTSTMTLTNGAFDANNYNFTATSFLSKSTNVRSLTLGTGTWTVGTLDLAASNGAASSNLTLTTTNSSVVVTTLLNTGRNNFNNVSTSTGTGTLAIHGTCSFNTVTVASAPTGTNIALAFAASTTFTISNLVNTRTRCSLITSTTAGTRCTLALASGSLSPRYFAFKDVAFTGPGTWTTSIFNFCFDGGNNTGTTFESAYYYIASFGNTWTSAGSWSNTFGGTSNGAVPTASTNVVLEPLTVNKSFSLPANGNCLNFVAVARTNTVILSGGVTISGGCYFGESGVTINSGAYTFNATTSGNTLYIPVVAAMSITLNGVGGEWTLGANTSIFFMTLTNGTFKTANYNLTFSNSFNSSNSNVRAIYLGSSTLTTSNLNFGTSTNLTFDAGTSTVSASGTISLNDTAPPTFYNFTIPERTSVGVTTATITGTILVSNLFTLGASSNVTFRRSLVSSLTGVPVTINCNSVNAGWANVDFSDIVLAGAAVAGGPISGTNLGNSGGNSNIVFRDSVPRFWNLPAGGNWSDVAWAANSGSTPDAAYFPLPQDIVYIESTGLDPGATITLNSAWSISGIDLLSRTSSNSMTLSVSANTTPRILGNWVNGSGVTVSGTGTITFVGRTPVTIQSNGRSFNPGIILNVPTTNTVSLVDSLTILNFLTLTNGKLDLNGNTLTCSTFSTSALTGAISNLTFNSGIFLVSGASFQNGAANFTTTAGVGTGIIRMTSASAKTFTGLSATYNCTLANSGAGALTISGSNTFTTLANEVTPATFTFTAGTVTTVTNWNIAGTAGNLVTIGSTSSSQATLVKSSGVVSTDYLTISNSNATGGAQWFPGANSVNGSNNSGWLFSPGFFLQLFY